MIEQIIIFIEIVLIDLVLAGDNALIIGMVASQFDEKLIKKNKWIGWLGLLAILTVAIELIYADIKIFL